MTSAADDDFESLFEEVAAQRAETVNAAAAAPAASAAPAAAPAEAPAPAAEAPARELNDDERQMFERLGGITRTLHNSLRELGLDRTLNDAHEQIKDSTDRLLYIATLTEQAATKTLNAIDAGIPDQDKLAENAKDIETRWDALFAGQMGIDAFKTLATDSKAFAARVGSATDAEKARLLEIMMAQDFQDITGQLIKKIVTITKNLENELAQLLREYAPADIKAALAEASAAKKAEPKELMQGPSVQGEALVQDDVDSLLADLGF